MSNYFLIISFITTISMPNVYRISSLANQVRFRQLADIILLLCSFRGFQTFLRGRRFPLQNLFRLGVFSGERKRIEGFLYGLQDCYLSSNLVEGDW